jgi:hypothetical protein
MMKKQTLDKLETAIKAVQQELTGQVAELAVRSAAEESNLCWCSVLRYNPFSRESVPNDKVVC